MHILRFSTMLSLIICLSGSLLAQELDWAFLIGGSGGHDQANGVATDIGNNVYVTGCFRGIVDFDPNLSGEMNLTSNGAQDIYLAKYNTSGELTWAFGVGSALTNTHGDIGEGIALDSEGNIYITGYYGGDVDFDPSENEAILPGSGGDDFFIAKYDNDGNFLWADHGGSNYYEPSFSNSIIVDNNDNVVITGSFNRRITIGSYSLDIGSGNTGAFLAKYDPTGTVVFATELGGTEHSIGNAVVCGPTGALYVMGDFLGPDQFGAFQLSGGPSLSVFICKIDTGGEVEWANEIVSQSSVNGKDLKIDQYGNQYLTGDYYQTIDADPGSSEFNLVSNGGSDIFMLSLNVYGEFRWGYSIGNAGDDYSYGIGVSKDQEFCITGRFDNELDVDPSDNIYNLTSGGAEDAFVAAYSFEGNLRWAASFEDQGSQTDQGTTVSYDQSNNIICTGSIAGTVDFDPQGGQIILTTGGSEDSYIVKLSGLGTFPHSSMVLHVPAIYSTIQAGLNAADSTDMVLVQPGTYYENIIWPETNGIALISAGDSSNTIIDGGGLSTVIYINPQTVVMDTTTLIQGFMITNGGNVNDGAGIYLNNASPILSGLMLQSNAATNYGGGIYMSNSNSMINGGIYKENAAYRGGGIYMSYSSPELNGNTITENTTTNNGGGIYIINSSPVVSLSNIAQNSGAIGGGIYMHSSTMVMTRGTISENSSTSDGGGLSAGVSSFSLTDVSISGNSCAGLGGGIRTDGAFDVSMDNVRVTRNTSMNKGGGIFLWRTSAIISDTRIVNNIATTGGGGISISHNSDVTIAQSDIIDNATPGYGGGLHIYNSSPTIDGGTILGNSGTEGAAIFSESAESSPVFTNISMLSNNGNGMLVQSGNMSISNSNIAYNGIGINSADELNNVDASGNYWGHSSGPYHQLQNPSGQGDSANVDVTPWLTTPNVSAPPIPAQNVRLSGFGNEFISLRWDPSLLNDFAGFKLYYDSDSSGYPYSNSVDVGLDTSYTLSGLTLGTEYFISVTVYDTDGNESWYSNEVVGTTRVIEVQNLDIADDEDLLHIITHDPRITFDYFDTMDEAQTYYQIQISTDLTYQSGIIWDSGVVASDANSVQYIEGMLENGLAYYVRVKVASGDFWSEWADLSFRMNSDPSDPNQNSLINNVIAPSEIVLTINNSMDLEGDALTYDFRLYEDEVLTNLLDSAIAVLAGIDETSWTLSTTLPENGRFWWTVQAFDGYEYSSLVGPESFLVNSENDLPGEFALLEPSNGGNSIILTPTFTWQSSHDLDPLDTLNYTLYLDTPAPGVEVFSTGLDTFFQVLTPLLDNASYHWKVTAQDLNGGQTESSDGYRSFTVNTINDLPTTFQLLTPVHDMMVTTLTPQFLWEASSDPDDETIALRETGKGKCSEKGSSGNNSVNMITGYDFYLGTGADLLDAVPVEVIGTSYIPADDLIENMVYYWAVSALDDSGGVTFSDTASFWTNSYNDHPSAFNMLEPLGDFLFELDMLTPTYRWSQSLDPDLYDEVIYHLYLWHSPWHSEEINVGSDTSYTHFEPLLDNYVYSWEVIAEDMSGAMTAAGIGDSVAQIHFYTNTENDIPEPAVLLSPDSVVVLTSTPTFIWEASFDRDPFEDIEYEVHWWYEGSEWDSIITEETSITISNPLTADNQQYFWQVLSMDDEGGIAQSEDYMFWVDFLPEPPGLFSLVGPEDESAGNSTRPELTWQEAIDPDPFENVHYRVNIATDSSMSNIIYDGISLPEIHVPEVDLQNDTRYYWQVSALDEDSLQTLSEVWTFDVGYLAVDAGLALPTEYVLDQNYPNPFNPSTTLRYGLPDEATVSLVIFDIRGNTVKTFTSETKAAGWYEHAWKGLDDSGQPVSTGLYLTRIQAGSYSKVIKMLYLK